MNACSTEDTEGREITVSDTVMVVSCHLHLSHLIECVIPLVNANVSFGACMITMCVYRFIHYQYSTSLV